MNPEPHGEASLDGLMAAFLAADFGDEDEAVVGDQDTEAPLPSEEVLKVPEVARLLRMDRKSVYAAIARGEIPGVQRIGGAIRVRRTALLRWMDEGQGRVSRSRRDR